MIEKKDVLEKMNDLIYIQKGEIDTNEYMRGMFNGMLVMRSIIDDKNPKFAPAPVNKKIEFEVDVNEKGTVKTFEIDKSKFQLMRENVNRWEFMEKPQ